jgi:hydrogenase expression/formation protein HypE
MAAGSSVGIEVDSSAVLVREEVRGACEILGLDPLFVANEGKLLAFVPPEASAAVLAAMRDTPQGREARLIGRAVDSHRGMVLLKTEIGGTRVLDLPFTEQLPRIC